MGSKRSLLRILTAFVTTIIAVIFGSSSTKALSVTKPNPAALTIEERLAKVRKQIGEREIEVNSIVPLYYSAKKNDRSTWSNAWSNWGNGNSGDSSKPKKS